LRKRERRSSLSLRRRLSYVGKVFEITKVLVALSLYENLKREGELLSMPSDIDSEVKRGVSRGVVQKAAALSTL